MDKTQRLVSQLQRGMEAHAALVLRSRETSGGLLLAGMAATTNSQTEPMTVNRLRLRSTDLDGDNVGRRILLGGRHLDSGVRGKCCQSRFID